MANYVKLYGYGARTTHLTKYAEDGGLVAVCGYEPTLNIWYGLGSDTERSKVERLPLCKECEKTQ